MRSKILFTLLLIPLLAIVGGLSYLSYRSYNDFSSSRSARQYLEGIGQLERAASALQNEELLSALYLANDGDPKFSKKLHAARNGTNEVLKRLSTSDLFNGIDRQRLETMKKSLEYVRSSVDALAGDYGSLFGESFSKEIYGNLRSMVRSLGEKLSSVELRKEVSVNNDLLMSRTTLGDEKAYLAYLIFIHFFYFF